MARLNRRQQGTVNETADATYNRLHDNPAPRDIHSGDALNIVLTELSNPKVYTQVVQKSTPADRQRAGQEHQLPVRREHDPDQPGGPQRPGRARRPGHRPDVRGRPPGDPGPRRARAKKEAESSNQVSLETLRSFRAAVQALKDKADAAFDQGTRQRDESDNFLKALLGLSKMLERPQVEQFLKGLDRYPHDDPGPPDHLHAQLQPPVRRGQDAGAGGGLRPALPAARAAPRPVPGGTRAPTR